MQQIRKLCEKTKKAWKKMDKPVLKVSAQGDASLCGESGTGVSFSKSGTVGILSLVLAAAALLIGAHCLFFRLRRKLSGKEKKDPSHAECS
ncbi:MAG: hypothetical protein IJR89_07640 [Clostridia bacterium]|nr:hypothetical protein [Clostridia bacterium]